MEAEAPAKVRPVTVTGLPVPVFLSAKKPTAPFVTSVTMSLVFTPLRMAFERLRTALVSPSYSLFSATTPSTQAPSPVMSAVRPAGWVTV